MYFTLSFRVVGVQESPSVLWETSIYLVPAKQCVHLASCYFLCVPTACFETS